MKEIIIASGNKGKIEETQEILVDFRIIPMNELGINIEVEEDKNTFKENAIKKAEIIAKELDGKMCIADDSGIEIEYLDGFPGVCTKRWHKGTDRERNLAIIDKLKGIPKEKRKIRFVTAIAISNGHDSICVEGVINGYVSETIRGENGFGFDEIFELENGKTLAELTKEAKNEVSARRIALEKLKEEIIKMKKMVVSDYDLTFYINDKDIELNKKSVNKFMSLGNIFVIATGRSYLDLKNKQKLYDFKYDYVILNHGATIMDKTNNILLNIPIQNSIINELKESLELEKSLSYFCCSGIDSRVEFKHNDLTKINVQYDSQEEAMRKVKIVNEKFRDFVNAYYVNNNSMEIISNKTNKSKAIYETINETGISKNNVYTIGDGYSDIEMIREFNGYCMKESVDELKKLSIKEFNSVSTLIEELLNK